MIEVIQWSNEPRPQLRGSAYGLQVVNIPIRDADAAISTVERHVAHTLNPDLQLHIGPRDIVEALILSSRQNRLRTPRFAALLVETNTLDTPIKPAEDTILSDTPNSPPPDNDRVESLAYLLQLYNSQDAYLIQREVRLAESLVALGRGEPLPRITRKLKNPTKAANIWQVKFQENSENEPSIPGTPHSLGVRSRTNFMGGESIA